MKMRFRAIPDAPVSILGQMWILDKHRLYVGDATVPADIGRLMGGEFADLVFTDPP
jgi:DNA modification methylase